MSKTLDALQQAFAGESQANRRYLSFARKAEEDGFPHIAKIFRVAAEAETVHALNYLKVMGGSKVPLRMFRLLSTGKPTHSNACTLK